MSTNEDTALTQHDVRLALAESVASEPNMTIHREVHPTIMVANGLELEKQQCV